MKIVTNKISAFWVQPIQKVEHVYRYKKTIGNRFSLSKYKLIRHKITEIRIEDVYDYSYTEQEYLLEHTNHFIHNGEVYRKTRVCIEYQNNSIQCKYFSTEEDRDQWVMYNLGGLKTINI